MEHAALGGSHRSNVAPVWCVQVLTGAAQPLLPQAQQQALAHVAVNRPVEMFHPPEVLTVRLGHLVVKGTVRVARQRALSPAHRCKNCQACVLSHPATVNLLLMTVLIYRDVQSVTVK